MANESGIQIGIDGEEYFYLPESGDIQVREALDRLLPPYLRDQILTPSEVQESRAGILGQAEVSKYHSYDPEDEGGYSDRARTLRMPDWARVYASAGYPLTPTARHTPEEGLNEMPYGVFLVNQMISDLATRGANAQDAVLPKVMACDMRAMMLGEETMGDLDALVSPELIQQMADQYFGDIHVSQEELELVREKVGNWVFSLYKLIHDEHLQLRSQGGLDQLPVHILNHFIRHNERAEICFEALRQVREQRNNSDDNSDLADIDFDEVEQYLMWPAMLNVAAANLLRNSPPLSPSFSDTAIIEQRKEILRDAKQALAEEILPDEQKGLLLELVELIRTDNLEGEEGAVLLVPQYQQAVSLLGGIAEIQDRDHALQLLDEVIPDVEDVQIYEQCQLDVLEEMKVTLQNGHSAIHLEDLTGQQYKAILWLQKRTGRNILRQIAIQPQHRGIRPGWDVEMDTLWHRPNREDTIETLEAWGNNESSPLSAYERQALGELLTALQLSTNPLLLNEEAITTRLSGQHLALLRKIEELSAKRLLAAKIPLVSPAFTGTALRKLHDVLSRPFYKSLWPHTKSSRPKELSPKELRRLSQSEQAGLRGGLTMQEMVEAHIANAAAERYLKGLYPDMEPVEVKQHMWGDKYEVEPPSALQGVDKAAIVIRDVILQLLRGEEGKIAVIGDCDEDGMNAAAIWIRALKALTGQDVDSTLNNRIEGHNVQFADLLNFVLMGNRTIIINDTGSGSEDAETYRLFRDGVSCVEDLQVFYEICDRIEDVNIEGKDYISTRRLKSKITRFTNYATRVRDLFNSDRESAYQNANGMKEYFEMNPEAVWDDYFRVLLGGFVEGLDETKDMELIRFINGSPDVNLIVIDHHTPSVEMVRYLQEQKLRAIVENIGTVFPNELLKTFSDGQFAYADLTTIRELRGRLTQTNGGHLDRNVQLTIEEQEALEKLEALVAVDAIRLPDELNRIVMVNPEWVKEGQEEVFLGEMEQALKTKKSEKIREVQRRHCCYTVSELVGSMTAWKVTKRLYELFNTDPIIQADAQELFGLDDEERKGRLAKISRQIRGGLFPDRGEGAEVHFGGKDNAMFKLDVSSLLEQKGAKAKIQRALREFRNSWVSGVERAYLQYIQANPKGDWKGFAESENYQHVLNYVDDLYGVEVIDHKALKQLVGEENNYQAFPERQLVATQKEIDLRFEKKITELVEKGELSLGEVRFYLAYNRELPKSLFDRDESEKAPYFTQLARRVGFELGQIVRIKDSEGLMHTVSFTGYSGSWTEIKKSLYRRINSHLREHGVHPDLRTTEGEFTKKKRLALARQLADEYWDQAVAQLMKLGESGVPGGITPEEAVFLNAWAKGRAYGSKQGLINAAIAQIVDYGEIRGEGRILVRQAMDLVTEEIEKAYDRTLSRSEKQKLRNRLPPVLRILNTATTANLNQLSLYLTRNWSHSWGAAENLLFRCRAIVGRDAYADELLKQAIIFITTRREGPDISRLRKAIKQERDKMMEYREELFKKAKQGQASKTRRRKEKRLPARDNVVVVKLPGNPKVDPIYGVMGLVAGDLAREYGKPALVFHRIRSKRQGGSETVRCSVRLPNEGSIDWDIVLMNWRLNPVDGFVVTKCGGHPGAAGAEIEISDMEKFLDAVDTAFEGFEQIGRYSGVVRLDDVKPGVIAKLQEEGLDDAQAYGLKINYFNVAKIVGESIAPGILEPYGKDTPNLELDISGVKVLNMVHGQRTKDGNDYIVAKMEDPNGHIEELRVFNKLHEWEKVQIGDVLTVRVEARMSNRPAAPARIENKISGVEPDGSDSNGYYATTVRGYIPRSKLYINEIVSNSRATEP